MSNCSTYLLTVHVTKRLTFILANRTAVSSAHFTAQYNPNEFAFHPTYFKAIESTHSTTFRTANHSTLCKAYYEAVKLPICSTVEFSNCTANFGAYFPAISKTKCWPIMSTDR